MKIAPASKFLAVGMALAVVCGAPQVRAQSTDQSGATAPKPKKKKPKKKPVQEESPTPPAAAEETPAPAPASEEAPKAAATDEGKPPATGGDESKPAAASQDDASAHASGGAVDNTNTREDPQTRYYFVGLRYRGTVIPQFLLNVFVDEGATIYSNMFGAEFEIRKGGQSMIPWITYADFSTGDMLFHQKGSDTAIAGNYSDVKSSLKMIIFGLDELWSVPLDAKQHFAFEYGFGVGVGIVFGDLQNNWVSVDPNGPLVASTGVHYTQCAAGTIDNSPATPAGCNTNDHQMTTTRKIGGFKEPFWFSGGSVPNIFPNVWFPTLALRYKPIKQFQARLGVGFSLTGFWFGLSGDYGLESTGNKGGEGTPKAEGMSVRMRDML